MNEFLKLKWDNSSQSYLEKRTCSFISDDVLLDSYVYKHLGKRLMRPKKPLRSKNVVESVPGKKYLLKIRQHSLLSKLQQETYLRAIKLLSQNKPMNQMSERETNCLNMYKELMINKIPQEHQLFAASAQKSWEFTKVSICKLRNNLYRHAWTCLRKQMERYLDYGDYYKELDLISLTYTEDENISVEVNCIQNLLEMGTLARFSCPTLKIECRLRAQTLPPIPTGLRSNSKLPVSQDENVRNLLKDNDIDVVISSSGLKRLLDNSDPKAQWKIPLKIEMIEIEKDGKKIKKKVVFIDKPLLSSHNDPLDLKYYSMKRLVKTNFCQYEAFRFDKQDTHPNEKLADLNKKLLEFEKKMEEDEENSSSSDQEGNKAECKKKANITPNIIHHNVNYRVWKFRKTVNNFTLLKNTLKSTEFNLLVRSKLDGCETTESGNLQPVIIDPKIELQLEYGANVPTKSELCRQWISLFFRPFSTLYRVRLHWNTAEVVSVEKCSAQKILSEANSLYQFNPNIGLGTLNNLLNKLIETEPGNYLLIHSAKNEYFVSLWTECQKSEGSLKLKNEHKNCIMDPHIKRDWVPVDLNYILPLHEHQNRPPGCFPPPLPRVFKKGKKTKKKRQQSRQEVTNVEGEKD